MMPDHASIVLHALISDIIVTEEGGFIFFLCQRRRRALYQLAVLRSLPSLPSTSTRGA
jgi:hypothetical protein